MTYYIREWRTIRAFSLRELSEKCHVAPGNINRIERGLTRPRPTTVRKLARALRARPEDLVRPPTSDD